MKKIIYKISIYKVLPPYKNWYSITTDDGLNRSNVVIVGKKQLLKVALALIIMVLFNKGAILNKFKTKSRNSRLQTRKSNFLKTRYSRRPE